MYLMYMYIAQLVRALPRTQKIVGLNPKTAHFSLKMTALGFIWRFTSLSFWRHLVLNHVHIN